MTIDDQAEPGSDARSRVQEQALSKSIASNRVEGDRRKAIESLARRYAQLLDKARDTDDEVSVYVNVGPKYQAALLALGLAVAPGVAPPAPLGPTAPPGGDTDGPTPATAVGRLRAEHGRRPDRRAG